jgi:Phosphotransferase enzyme family
MKKTEILRIIQAALPAMKLPPQTVTSVHDFESTSLCRLWAGMGHLYRVNLTSLDSQQSSQQSTNSSHNSLVIKHIVLPSSNNKKSLSLSDKRKADSYLVEANFYEKFVPELLQQEYPVALPETFYVERSPHEIIIAMSFIEPSSRNHYMDNVTDIYAVLSWLARFHASCWGPAAAKECVERVGLQPIGTYWHLDTRPDEHAAMPNHGWQGRLKLAARAIDERLKRDPIQSVVHGDVKDANVLFTPRHQQYCSANETDDRQGARADNVVLCDFQYSGQGAPTKDLAYFFSSSVGSSSAAQERKYLEFYLNELSGLLQPGEAPSLLDLQDSLDLAYCDFYRFMSGWGFWASNSLGEERVLAVLNRLDGGSKLKSEQEYSDAMWREYG